jgi:Uma2 family endonuclease
MGTSEQRAATPATYADVLKAPPGKIAEVLAGELFVSPRPSLPHARVSSLLGIDLGSPFDRKLGGPGGPGGWWILDEPEIHLGADILVPDLAGWRRERLSKVPKTAFIELAPDWVCEVVSPGSRGTDRVRKMPLYAKAGVAHIWLIDPNEKLLEVFQLSGSQWLSIASFEGAQTVRAEPFDAVELDMTRWWIEDD